MGESIPLSFSFSFDEEEEEEAATGDIEEEEEEEQLLGSRSAQRHGGSEAVRECVEGTGRVPNAKAAVPSFIPGGVIGRGVPGGLKRT